MNDFLPYWSITVSSGRCSASLNQKHFSGKTTFWSFETQKKKGKWLVAIDMFPGPSSQAELQSGIIEMIDTEKANGVRGQPLERWLNGSAPYRFTKAEFGKN